MSEFQTYYQNPTNVENIPSFPCPVCGFVTFYKPPGSNEICAICGWYNDALQLRFPYLKGGANGYSLKEAQDIYSFYGTFRNFHNVSQSRAVNQYFRDPYFRPLAFYDKVENYMPGVQLSWPENPYSLYWFRPEFWLNADRKHRVQKTSPSGSERKSILFELFTVEFVAFGLPIFTAIILGIQSLVGHSSSGLIQPFVNNVPADIFLHVLADLVEIYPVVLIAYVLNQSGRRLSDIGFGMNFDWASVGYMVLLVVLFFGSSIFISSVAGIFHLIPPSDQVTTHTLSHFYEIVGISDSLRTAMVEEIAVCAFMIDRLEKLGLSRPAQIAISTLVRMSYHVYGGWLLVLLNVPVGIFQAALYIKRRNIKEQVGAHFIYDSIIFSLNLL